VCVRVVSFNIQHGRGSDGAADAELTGRECARLAPDVLGLQEVDRGVGRSGRADEADVVASATGLSSAFGVSLAVDGGVYGNALLVRGRLSDVETLELPNRAGLEPRTVLLASAEIDAAEVSVGVTHLSTDRSIAVRQLLAVLEVLWRRPPPRLLLGDFNLRPGAAGPVLDAARMSVSDAVATFPSWRPNHTIDYVAASGLVVAAARAEAMAVSDHCALVTEVTDPSSFPAASPRRLPGRPGRVATDGSLPFPR
jgi:endonuclease/exonuclease/phosphatase family metal-dependent hydrolase